MSLARIADFLNSKDTTVRRFAKVFPQERVLLATAATILPAKDREPIGWSFKRYFQRRGVLVVSDQRFFATSSSISFLSVMWLVIGLLFLYQGLKGGEPQGYLLAMMSFAFLWQRRPYVLNIPLTHIIDLTLGSVRGLTGLRSSLVTVIMEDIAYNFVTAQPFSLPKEDILSRKLRGEARL